MSEKRTVNIHGREYEVVASRVERFREDFPIGEGKIGLVTEIISIDPEIVVMQARIVNLATDAVLATGHAEERRDSSHINKTSALENCETSAIGRALASAGYIGGEFASADEVANAIKQQGEPARKTETPAPKSANLKAKQKQLVEIMLKLGDGNKELAKDHYYILLADHGIEAKEHNELTLLEADTIIDAAIVKLHEKESK